MSWSERVSEWLKGPCISCEESSSLLSGTEHVGMPVTRPQYVDNALEQIAGPNEQHALDPNAHCVNPKCDYYFTPQDEEEIQRNKGWFKCPKCGYEYDYLASAKNPTYDEGAWAWGDPEAERMYRTRPANPGGITRSGLTLDEMGQIGEQVVERMGELPGVGAVIQTFPEKHNPVDAIIQGQKGKFGCEIKTNHSQAQARFKIGGKAERHQKIVYCLENGLKPALIGVRLNFYTDKAYVFFREGLTDTWIGNAKMMHVATLDFSDLNPFKSPDPQAQALAVDNADLPDQSDEEDEFDSIFGPKAASVGEVTSDFNDEHPRDHEGKFTFKHDVHEIKVVDDKGKHSHTIKRCKHCGHIYKKDSDHQGRIECPTCGQDPERQLALAKVVLAGPTADEYARNLGFTYLGQNSNGHRRYNWTDPQGTNHPVVVGSGAHGKRAAEIDATYARQRMSKCLSGKCNHVQAPPEMQVENAPGAPLFKAGQTIQTNTDQFGTVLSIDGDVALIQNFNTGGKEWVPAEMLRAVASESVFEEWGEPWSPVPKFQPGEHVTFRGGGGGTVLEDAEPSEGTYWYRVKTETGTVQAPEEAMLRPDAYDQPGESTLNDWGIPPEGEQYYRTASGDPDYLYVYYMGELKVEPYQVNLKYERMLRDLLQQFHVDLTNDGMDIDTTKVDAGEIHGSKIEHKQLSDPTVREQAEKAIKSYFRSR